MTVGQDRGLPVLADGGFNGRRRIEHWKRQYGVTVIAPRSKNRKGDKSRKKDCWLAKESANHRNGDRQTNSNL